MQNSFIFAMLPSHMTLICSEIFSPRKVPKTQHDLLFGRDDTLNFTLRFIFGNIYLSKKAQLRHSI